MRIHLLLPLVTVLAAPGLGQGTPHLWHRVAEWTIRPDSDHGTTQGNPAPDSEGHLVWNHEDTATGGGLGSANPWFEEPTTPMLWDKSWFGQPGVWSTGNDFGALIGSKGLAHVGEWYAYRPILRWKNVTGRTFDLSFLGTLRVRWGGNQVAEPVEVDVVLAHRDGATGALTMLYSTTVDKPTQDGSFESVYLPIDLGPVPIGLDDEIILTHHSYESYSSLHFVYLHDNNLCFLRLPIGSRFCSPNEPSSIELPGLLVAVGSTKVVDHDFHLKAFQLPLNQFGMFLASKSQGFVQHPGGSDGNLCLGGGIGRFTKPGQVYQTGEAGTGVLDVDLNAIPTPQGPVAVQPGETWYFQSWFRDGGSSNFTDAIAVTFE